MVVKSTNRSRFGSDLCLRQPTDQKAGGSNPSRRAKKTRNRKASGLFVCISCLFRMLPICGLMWFLRKPCEVLNVDDRSLILRSSPFRHQANSPRRLPVSVSWATVYRPTRRPLLRLRMLPYRSIHRSFVSSLSKAMCHVGEYRQCLITAQPVTGKCGSLYLCRDAAR